MTRPVTLLDEATRIANALERIATALESTNARRETQAPITPRPTLRALKEAAAQQLRERGLPPFSDNQAIATASSCDSDHKDAP